MNNTESTLPSNRAFVVQFRTATEQAQENCSGRVEHLVSGQAVCFESWEHLQQFIQEMLTKVGEKPPQMRDPHLKMHEKDRAANCKRKEVMPLKVEG